MAHFERDLHRRGTIGGEEAVPEVAAGQGRETLRQCNGRLMREAGQDHVLEPLKLRADSRIDSRIGVSEQIDPPGADRVQVAPAFEVVQPWSAAMRYGHHRQPFVQLHLGARMPDRAQCAGDQIGT